MKISVYSARGGHRENIRHKRRQLLLLCLILIGVITGAVLVYLLEDVDSLIRLRFTQNIFKKSRSITFFQQFKRSLLPLMGLLGIEFFAGSFAFGQVVVSITVLIRGVASGLSAAAVYLLQGFGGMPTLLLSVLPLSLGGALLLLIGGGEAWQSANRIAAFCFTPSEASHSRDVRLYSVKFAFMAAAAALICLIDTAVIYWVL